MTDNTVKFPGITSLPMNPEVVLREAAEIEFDRVIVIGVTKEGEEYFASSDPDGGTFLWDLERARYGLMKVTDKMLNEE